MREVCTLSLDLQVWEVEDGLAIAPAQSGMAAEGEGNTSGLGMQCEAGLLKLQGRVAMEAARPDGGKSMASIRGAAAWPHVKQPLMCTQAALTFRGS